MSIAHTILDNKKALAFLLDTIETPVITLNKEKIVVFINAPALEFYQWSESVCNGSYSELCHKCKLIVPSSFDDVSSFTHEISHNNKIRHVRWMVKNASDMADEPLTFLMGTEITEYKEIEDKYKTIESRLNAVIEAMPGNYWWKDLDGIYRGYNTNLIKTLGLNSVEDVIGKSDYDLPWKDQAKELYENDAKVIKTGIAYVAEEDVLTKDGRLLTFRVTKTPLKNFMGETIGTLGTSVDITDRKILEKNLQAAKEEAEVANKLNTQLLSMLGDELKDPLTTIMVQAQRLEQLPVLGTRREYAQIIIDTAIGLKKITDDIVDFSQGQTQIQYLHQSMLFDFKLFLEDIVLSNQLNAQQQGISIILDYPSGTPNWMRSDKLTWRKIINYFLTQTIQASKCQEVVIGIKSIKQGNQWEFMFTLYSQGTAVNKIDTVIDTIHHRAVSTESNIPRLLGIERVTQLIELLGGKLCVEYHSITGWKITCVLTVEYNKNPPVVTYPWTAYQEKIPILIVDNSPRSLVIRQHLGQHNIKITGTTEDVLKILKAALVMKAPYKIVIVGNVHRGSSIQHGMSMRLAKDILREKDIPSPMLVLLSENDSMDLRIQAEKAGYFAVMHPFIGPMALQTELTANWEAWQEENIKDL